MILLVYVLAGALLGLLIGCLTNYFYRTLNQKIKGESYVNSY